MYASRLVVGAGRWIECVEFLDGLEEFVRQADSGSADVGLQLRHAGRPDDGSPEEALAEDEGEGQFRRVQPVVAGERHVGRGRLVRLRSLVAPVADRKSTRLNSSH